MGRFIKSAVPGSSPAQRASCLASTRRVNHHANTIHCSVVITQHWREWGSHQSVQCTFVGHISTQARMSPRYRTFDEAHHLPLCHYKAGVLGRVQTGDHTFDEAHRLPLCHYNAPAVWQATAALATTLIRSTALS